ncbi:MAG: class II fructose-bisphosphate aldolase [Spirochaetota bacterium]
METGKRRINDIMQKALREGYVVPAFNIPYLPMMEPTIRALADTESFGLIAVARLEWVKFGAKNLKAVFDEYHKYKDERYTRLHLDHTPVIDEDGLHVDYLDIISQAVDLGYDSVMVDGSRLKLEDNIHSTAEVVAIAEKKGIPVEGELGAVLGHEKGPLPPYEELFKSGKGFTDPREASRFVRETGVRWLSVAIGNIHGAITPDAKDKKKIEAKLNIEHLSAIYKSVKIPLVLHGGSGIPPTYIMKAIQNGIAKINIGTSTRTPFVRLMDSSIIKAQDAVYKTVVKTVTELGIKGMASELANE